MNFAFIFAVVMTGLIVGATVSSPSHFGWVLKTFFVVCTLALGVIAALVSGNVITDAKPAHLLPVVLLSCIGGATSIGFVGVAIEATALFPVGAAHSTFAIEFLFQVFGGVLGQMCVGHSGFAYLAGVTAVATLLLLLSFREADAAKAARTGTLKDPIAKPSLEDGTRQP